MIDGKKLVALCTSRIYEPQIHGYIERLNEKLREDGIALLIFAINSDIYWEEDRQATEKYVFDLIPYDYIDCVVIMDEKIKSHKIASKIVGRARECSVPVVIADGRYDGASSINFDYEAGFEKVVRHIIEFHHVTRPHMMAGQPDNEFSNRRIEVFKKVLAENNIDFDDSMISYGYFWADPCRIATAELLSRQELPEAIICANDVMAITVAEMFMDAGHRVPEDVLIAGFDGYSEVYFTEPKVTTASCDISYMAEVTADIVRSSIAGAEPVHKRIIPIFTPNESCGCPVHNEQPELLRDWFHESFARLNDDNRVLQQITSSMQSCSNAGELVSYLDSYKTENILCVVDRKCIDSDSNYFTEDASDEVKDFAIIYDSDYRDKYKPDSFRMPDTCEDYREDILSPQLRDRILELTDSGYPLIFNALDFMNKPFGFICFYFRSYYISNYSNTMNVTNAISIGIGGHANIQYQRTLLNKMDEMYRHDSLTGLYNRIGFLNIFNDMRRMPEIRGREVSVLMSDLDGLKYINDNFGHAEGDNAIFRVADALHQAIPETALAARFGGDEIFAIIFGEYDSDEIIRDIDRRLTEYNNTSGKPYTVSTSSGVIRTVLDDSFDITQAVKDADERMYAVKRRKSYYHRS